MGCTSTVSASSISRRNSATTPSASRRMSELTSESITKRPSRNAGRRSSMLIAGTESRTVIQLSRNWRTNGFSETMRRSSSGTKVRTSNASVSVTMSLTRRSRSSTPDLTAGSRSAHRRHMPSKSSLKSGSTPPRATLLTLYTASSA
eukprot:Amastigsp_a340473_24.p2 type:complete len:147 gc:universal Amastigsp_a340473_24:802-362(-)